MKFLAVLVTIFFYRNWQGDNPARQVFSFASYYDWFSEKNIPTFWRYALCVGVPSMMLLMLSNELSGWIQGLIWLAVSLAVLIYATEIYHLEEAFDEEIRWLRGVDEEQHALADVAQRQSDFQMAHVYDMFQSIVPGLFWFLILGPAGTLFYVFSSQYLQRLDDDDPEVETVDTILYWMEWVPARITGLLFTFVGNFGPTIEYWLNHLLDTEEAHAVHLSSMAAIATEHSVNTEEETPGGYARSAEASAHQLKSLCERALYGWLGVAGLFVIFSV